MAETARIVRDNRAGVKRNVRSKIGALLATAAFNADGEAKINAPVDTGFLKASVAASKVREGLWRVIVGASYAFWVEHGTARNPAQPFLMPAYIRQRLALIEAMNRLMKR